MGPHAREKVFRQKDSRSGANHGVDATFGAQSRGISVNPFRNIRGWVGLKAIEATTYSACFNISSMVSAVKVGFVDIHVGLGELVR